MNEETNYMFEFCCDTILRHLDNRGWYYVLDINRLMLYIDKTELIKILLYLDEERKFIERHESQDKSSLQAAIDYTKYNITSKGHGFIKTTSFLEERRKKDQEALLREQAYQIGKKNMTIAENTIKYWWAPIAVSFVTLVLSIVWHYSDKHSKDDTKKQIIELEQKVQETNTKTLYIVDSLWKTEHKTTPSKR